MDDGAVDGKQLRSNTQGFSTNEVEELAGLIRAKFGIVVTINFDKNRASLRCSAASMADLVRLVEPHTIPDMLYELSL
jgi:LAGLIDADG DNA endonuclease family